MALEEEAIASITDLDFDQSFFNTVAMWDSNNTIFDEIRFGNTFANVMGSTEPPRAVFHRGDTDGDGTLAITDAVSVLSFLFSGGGDTTCKETQDFDNDGSVVITDAVAILSFLFSGGAAPASPGPTSEPCGPDPDDEGSPGDLGCEAYESC